MLSILLNTFNHNQVLEVYRAIKNNPKTTVSYKNWSISEEEAENYDLLQLQYNKSHHTITLEPLKVDKALFTCDIEIVMTERFLKEAIENKFVSFEEQFGHLAPEKP